MGLLRFAFRQAARQGYQQRRNAGLVSSGARPPRAREQQQPPAEDIQPATATPTAEQRVSLDDARAALEERIAAVKDPLNGKARTFEEHIARARALGAQIRTRHQLDGPAQRLAEQAGDPQTWEQMDEPKRKRYRLLAAEAIVAADGSGEPAQGGGTTEGSQ